MAVFPLQPALPECAARWLSALARGCGMQVSAFPLGQRIVATGTGAVCSMLRPPDPRLKFRRGGGNPNETGLAPRPLPLLD